MIDLDKLKKYLENLSAAEKEELRNYFKDERPKGWISIEDCLPMMFAKDVAQGYSVFKVRDASGFESESKVADGNTWYYYAKEVGITHWLSE